MKVELKEATSNDLFKIVEILNSIILEGGFNADLVTYKVEEKEAWFNIVSSSPYALLCLHHQNEIIGYTYLSPWRGGREALAKVAEVSYYLKKEFRGNGFGKLMLKSIEQKAVRNGFKNLLAILLDTNIGSIKLLEKEGFHKAGHLPNIADLRDNTCGQLIYLKSLV